MAKTKYLIPGIEEMTTKERSRALDKKRGQVYRAKDPDKVRESKKIVQRKYSLQRKFNLSLEEYDQMLKDQNGACALCGFVPSGEDTYRKGKSLAVDHDHVTGYVRGLLCDLCNRGIGQLHDDPALLKKAAEYIEKASEESRTYLPW